MKTPGFISLVVLACSLVVVAKGYEGCEGLYDYLEPEDGNFCEQVYRLPSDMKEAYQDNVVLRMICFPSFNSEFVVGIRQREWKYSVFLIRRRDRKEKSDTVRKADGKVVSRNETNAIAKLRTEVPANVGEIDVEKISAPIDRDTAGLIEDVWTRMLALIRYPPQYLGGCDGETYHFSMGAKGSPRGGGKIWSPPEHTNCGLLVDVGCLLLRYAEAEPEKRDSILHLINARVRSLQADLKIADAANTVTVQTVKDAVAKIRAHNMIERLSDGTFSLWIKGLKSQNLDFLKGLPFSAVQFEDSKALTELTFAKGMPIRRLILNGTGVSDLTPLSGMRIVRLSICDSPVSNLAPLKGMPLRAINLNRTKVTDISPLRGMALVKVSMEDTPIQDISPLEGMLILKKA